MTIKADAIIKECKRLEESCCYTSTSFLIWLRFVRWINKIFIALPIVLAAISSWNILQNSSYKVFTALCALLAGLLPAISNALGFKFSIEEIAEQASDFKNLQDRFRQASEIDSQSDIELFHKTFEGLVQKLEQTRKKSTTPPEWCFKLARKKIEGGHYHFDADK